MVTYSDIVCNILIYIANSQITRAMAGTVRELYRLVRAKCPTIVFFTETRCSKTSRDNLKRKLKFQNVFVVPYYGRKGGLTLFWKH